MPVSSKKNQLSFNKMRTTFFFLLLVLLGIAMLYLFRPFFYPIFWAAVIAILFFPLYTFLNKHFHTPSLNASITIVAVITTIVLPLTIVGLLLVNQSINLYQFVSSKNLAQALTQAADWVQGTPFAPYIETAQQQWPNYVSRGAQTVSTYIFTSVRSITQNSLRFVLMLFVMFYSLFYFLKDGKKMLKRLMHLSPLGDKYEEMLYERFTSTTRATLKSTLIVGGIQGILAGILFWITGVEGAFIWGVIMVVLAMIPAIGPSLILLPAGIVMLIIGGIWQGIVLLLGAVIISFIDNLIRPPLIGKDIQLHPLIVFFATLGGLILFGISGFVIGPVIAALFISIMTLYDHYYKNELEKN